MVLLYHLYNPYGYCIEMLSQCRRVAVCRALTEKECVTGQILSNWFANKRKDMKKIAKEGLYCLYVASLCVFIN